MWGLNPWVILAGLLALASVGGAGYLKGYDSARDKCQTAALEAENATLRLRATAAAKLADEYAERLRVDAEADRLNQERADDTPPDDRSCLPRDSVGRLRGLN